MLWVLIRINSATGNSNEYPQHIFLCSTGENYHQIPTISQYVLLDSIFEPPHDKTNKMVCAPSEDSDQPGHPPSLISVFNVQMKKAWFVSYPLRAKQGLWADWVDAQADLSFSWVQRSFCWFCHEAAQIMYKRFERQPLCLERLQTSSLSTCLRHVYSEIDKAGIWW